MFYQFRIDVPYSSFKARPLQQAHQGQQTSNPALQSTPLTASSQLLSLAPRPPRSASSTVNAASTMPYGWNAETTSPNIRIPSEVILQTPAPANLPQINTYELSVAFDYLLHSNQLTKQQLDVVKLLTKQINTIPNWTAENRQGLPKCKFGDNETGLFVLIFDSNDPKVLTSIKYRKQNQQESIDVYSILAKISYAKVPPKLGTSELMHSNLTQSPTGPIISSSTTPNFETLRQNEHKTLENQFLKAMTNPEFAENWNRIKELTANSKNQKLKSEKIIQRSTTPNSYYDSYILALAFKAPQIKSPVDILNGAIEILSKTHPDYHSGALSNWQPFNQM